MAKQGTMDLTAGSPIKQIFLFSVPLILGTLFQQLYSFVDTVMVGRLIGDAALAAVGTTYSLNFLTLGFVSGSCVGYSLHAVFSGVSELAGRILGSWLSVAYLGFTGICFSNPMAWSCGLIYCAVMAWYFLRRRTAVSQ